MMFLLCFELTEKTPPDTGANDTPTPEEPSYDTEEIPDDRLRQTGHPAANRGAA
jgi:hypothetical protein